MDAGVLDIQGKLEKYLSENFDKFHGKKKVATAVAEWINDNFKPKKSDETKRGNKNQS